MADFVPIQLREEGSGKHLGNFHVIAIPRLGEQIEFAQSYGTVVYLVKAVLHSAIELGPMSGRIPPRVELLCSYYAEGEV